MVEAFKEIRAIHLETGQDMRIAAYIYSLRRITAQLQNLHPVGAPMGRP